MEVLIPVFIVVGAVIVTITIIIVKSQLSPKKISGVSKLIKAGKYQQAEKAAKSIIAKNPRDYIAHYLLGEAYYADQKTELAYMEYKTVNENALFDGKIPENTFRKRMAELYTRFNQNEAALREYLLLTKIEPNNAEYQFLCGQLMEAEGQNGKALGFYAKAIQLNPRHAKAHAAMGYILFRGKQYDSAKKEIDTAIKLSPDTYSSYYYLGKILKENQEYSAAVKALEKAKRDPDLKQKALIERGACFMAVTQVDNAIMEFEHAIKCSKDDNSRETIYARYFLASCYEKTRKIDKAIAQWEAIYAKNKTFRDVGQRLQEYKDLQSNDNMKEYLTSNPQRFIEICKKAAENGMKFLVKKIDQGPNGCTLLVNERKDDNWMSVRTQMFLIQFFRKSDPIDETTVRKTADQVKALNCSKGFMANSAGFTPASYKFAETRPVTLINKEKLEEILSKAGL